jgi:hypothetical protein
MSVTAMLASIGQNISGGCVTATSEDTGKQLNFEEEDTGFVPENSETMLPFKADQEGGLGTYGLLGGGKAVPLVLLTPENYDGFCLGCIGRDRVCLMKWDYCDMAKHERQKMNVTQACVHIMAHAIKQTKFAAYQALYVKVSQLAQSQYGQLVIDQHLVSNWNHIIYALNQANCEDDTDFEEVKTRVSKKLGSMPAFTPSKRVKFEGYDAAEKAFTLVEVPSSTKILLVPATSRSEEGAFALTEDAWDAMCA